MDAVPESRQSGGFLGEWMSAISTVNENPVAGWLMTARERRTQRYPLVRKLIVPVAISLVFLFSFLYAQRNSALISSSSLVELVTIMLTVSILPAVFFWALTGIFTAVQESLSLLADESKSKTSLTIDDMVSVSQMSSADIAVGALQVIMPQLFWRSLALSLSFWWLMLMLTSMFGVDLRAESFINTWIWGIVTVPLMLLSSLLACLALVLGCIAAGLHARGTLVPLTAAVLVMGVSFAWSLVGGNMLINDQYVLLMTRSGSIYGSVMFLVLALLVAMLMRRPGNSRAGLAILMPALAAATMYLFFRFVVPNQEGISSMLVSLAAGFMRSWGSFSLVNPLFVPTAASWGDVFGRNPVTAEGGFGSSLEMRWMIGFLTQLGLVWINAWLAWQCINRKRSSH